MIFGRRIPSREDGLAPTGSLIRTLHTPRLVLEPQVAAHADEMYVVLSDPAIYAFENSPPDSVATLRARYQRLESRRSPDGRELWLNWVVRLKEAQRAIGYVQATVLPDAAALIAYEFGSAWWGRGLAHEAVAASMEELRCSGSFTRFGAVFKSENERSRRLLARLGMRPAGRDEFPSERADPDESAMVTTA